MKISEYLRQYTDAQGLPEEEVLEKGMEEKTTEFAEKGAEVYINA